MYPKNEDIKSNAFKMDHSIHEKEPKTFIFKTGEPSFSSSGFFVVKFLFLTEKQHIETIYFMGKGTMRRDGNNRFGQFIPIDHLECRASQANAITCGRWSPSGDQTTGVKI